MKCSQVTHQVFCHFYYKNTADEDYYILEDNTPLEGLHYPYLTIKQGDKVIEYRGAHLLRTAPTKDSYVLIEAGKTITSPVVDLTSSYKFDSDGIYTIEYTKPFVYISDAELSNVEEDDEDGTIVSYLGTKYGGFKPFSVLELVNTDNFVIKPIDAEIRMETYWQYDEDNYDLVYGEASCMKFRIGKNANHELDLEIKNIEEVIKETKEVHETLCGRKGFDKSLNVVAQKSSKSSTYTKFFKDASNDVPSRVLGQCVRRIQNEHATMTYIFGGLQCFPTVIAFVLPEEHNIIHLCRPYARLPKHRPRRRYGNKYTRQNTKFQTIAHEMTHAFANTKDFKDHCEGYGYENCEKLDKVKAVENADSYSYFVQDVYHQWRMI